MRIYKLYISYGWKVPGTDVNHSFIFFEDVKTVCGCRIITICNFVFEFLGDECYNSIHE